MPPTGLVIMAWKRGFRRRIAENRVEPERGRPDMKWMPCRTGERAPVSVVGETVCRPLGGTAPALAGDQAGWTNETASRAVSWPWSANDRWYPLALAFAPKLAIAEA